MHTGGDLRRTKIGTTDFDSVEYLAVLLKKKGEFWCDFLSLILSRPTLDATYFPLSPTLCMLGIVSKSILQYEIM